LRGDWWDKFQDFTWFFSRLMSFMSNNSREQEAIVNLLKEHAKKLGRTPTQKEFSTETGVKRRDFFKFFDGYKDALQMAGLPEIRVNNNPPLEADQLLADWGRVVRMLCKTPTITQYDRHGFFHSGTFAKKFGKWSDIPETFLRWAASSPEWYDVLQSINEGDSNVSTPISGSEAVVSEGAPDSSIAASNQSQIDRIKCMDGESTAAIGHFTSKPDNGLIDEQVYGDPIDFRGLRHEPVNEQGVVFIYGMVARELGYSVECVRSGFPDCEAKRQAGPGKWKRARIEFELESKNYIKHGHPLDGCDVLVCWRHNWPGCPGSIEIVELGKILKKLT
jgi:hypothetical protein